MEDSLKERERRTQHNQDIINRMKSGDILQYSATLTWFPPRPSIPKDDTIIKKLYGDDVRIVGNTKNIKKFTPNIVKETPGM